MSCNESFLQFCGGVNANSLKNTLSIHNSSEDDVNDESNYIDVLQHSSYYDTSKLEELLAVKKNNFCILSTNIECLGTKYDELVIFVTELRKKGFEFSAICIQETWLAENVDISQYTLKGYTCIHQGKSVSNKSDLIV